MIGDTLAHEVIRFLQDAELRKARGERAQKVVEDNRGAVDRHMMLINRYIAAI